MENIFAQAEKKAQITLKTPLEIKLFLSNNAHNDLTIEEAYQRFVGPQQENLEKSFLNIAKLFDSKISLKNATRVLGTYHLPSNGQFTADNSIIYHFSGDALDEKSLINLAAGSDHIYNQDSILTFVVMNEKNSPTVDIKVEVKNPCFKIKEFDEFITSKVSQGKLPLELSKNGYSLEIKQDKKALGFPQAQVQSFEIIVGSRKDAAGQFALEQVKKVFAQENVQAQYGKGFLIYHDGRKELIEKRALA